MADESPFEIRDRRRAQEDPAPPQAAPAPSSDAPLNAEPSARLNPPHEGEQNRNIPPAAASFSELVFTLGTSALGALGVQSTIGETAAGRHPGDAAMNPAVDLEQARHLIDLLDILERKTAGNLTPDEQQLLQQLLYTLRLTFVERSRTGPIAPPGGAR